MTDTQKALDNARAEIANLSILYEHAKEQRDAHALHLERVQNRNLALMVELAKLRPVVEAARAIVTRDEWRAARMGVAELESYEAVEALGLLDALEQALAALDAGEDES